MSPTTPHGAAAALVDLGWSVFPTHEPDPGHPSGCSCHDTECEPKGKHPRVSRGLNRATRDFDQVDEWWTRWPGAGVGIATGEVSGMFVLDIDGAEGAASLADLPRLPETVEATTGRGHHIYFRMPRIDVRNSAGRVGEGLDVRGTGGYVIGPPSRHVSGRRYEWLRDPFEHDLADAPEWLVDLALKPEPEAFPAPREISGPRGSRYVEAAIQAECDELARTPEGGRNHRLNLAAFNLARFVASGDADPSTVARQLAFAAAQAGLDRRGIEKTINSAFKARGAA